jgi:hypothetical protein
MGMTLMNADSDGEIGSLVNGIIIYLADTPRVYVRADVPSGTNSVKFIYNGRPFRTDSMGPFSFNGNNRLDFFAFTPDVGCHFIRAEAYSDREGRGTMLAATKSHFCVVAVRPLVIAPVAPPKSVPIAVPMAAPVVVSPMSAPVDAPKSPVSTP